MIKSTSFRFLSYLTGPSENTITLLVLIESAACVKIILKYEVKAVTGLRRFANRSEVVPSIFQINVSIYFSNIMIHSILRPKWRQAFGDESRDADRPSIVFHITETNRSKCTFKRALLYFLKENLSLPKVCF